MSNPNQIELKALRYIKNTNGNAKRSHFIEDFAPIGKKLLNDVIAKRLADLDAKSFLILTDEGEKWVGQ